MSIKKIKFRILRHKPGHIDPPRYQEFSIEAKPGMTVLDALEAIRITRDSTLMYRHSCHHSSCGTCACLAPLDGFKPSGDLVVDISPLYDNISEDWSYLKNTENVTSSQMPEGIVEFKRFENCIECGACISACPVTLKNNGFIGPAVLAALSNELKKSPQKSEDLLSIAGDAKGESLCERAFNCSRVCPTGVYPGRQISDLHKVLKQI